MALLEASSAISSLDSPPRVVARTVSRSSGSSDHPSSGLASPTCSSSSPSQPSLYVAFKVLTLVNAFRKRVRRRSQAKRKVRPRKVAEDFCQDFERHAFEEVDRYLGRKTKGPKALKHKQSDAEGLSLKESFTLHDRSCQEGIDSLLEHIDQAVTVGGHSFHTTARKSHLFLRRNTDFHVKRLNIKGLEQLIVTVKDLLRTLQRNTPPHPTAPAFPADSTKQDPTLEFTYTANLEHLLLCLEQQLVLQFVKQLVDIVRKNVFDCQRDHERFCKEWFFEFPDARHPLSTTWPWAIKPSLAVLWGVCWMFYENSVFDQYGNLLDEEGNIIFPREMVLQYLIAEQGESQPRLSGEHQRQQQQHEQYEQPQGVQQQQGHIYLSEARMGQRGNFRPQIAEMSRPRQPPQPHQAHLATNSTTSPSTHLTRAREQAASTNPGLDAASTNTAYSAAPSAYPVADVSGWLPEVANFAGQQPGLTAQYNAYGPQQAEDLWQVSNQTGRTPQHFAQVAAQPGHSGVPHSSPLRRSGQVTPEIRVDTNFTNTLEYQALPQESLSSSATSYTTPYNEFPQYPVKHTHLSPQYSRQLGFPPKMADVQPPPMAQMESNTGIHSPVSDNQQSMQPSPRGSPMPEPMARKRSHSEMSQSAMQGLQQPMIMHELPNDLTYQNDRQSAQGSPYDETQIVMNEPTGHKVQRSIKRADPPQTSEGKYLCDWSEECADQIFDRKCEWSKHMDKHDRPYRCPQPQCAKLQGFTYSGGLLRHEREVHGKHGGPKEQLRCTVPECKRHTGKGFTRKENLNEHLRRVHNIVDPKDPANNASQLKQIAADAAPGAEAETPASRYSETDQMDELTGTGVSPVAYPALNKRRRMDLGTSPRSTSEDVENELARLRAENQEKDERIRRMEEADAEKEERLKRLEAALGNMSQGGFPLAPPDVKMHPQ